MLTTTSSSGFGARISGIRREAFTEFVVFNTTTTGSTITLPDYVNTVRIYAWGGGGGGGGRWPAGGYGGNGGDGGYVKADFPIQPGVPLIVRVAGSGRNPGGYPYIGGSGGGYSSVELPPAYPSKYLLVAGGGGGGGVAHQTPGPTGAARYPGGPAFTDGSTPPAYTFLKGLAGTISAGGVGGKFPIGAVPVPILGPARGPVYGPLPPTSGPSRQAQPGSFLTGGGIQQAPAPNGVNYSTGINGGGQGYFVGGPPAWPGISPAYEPGPYAVEGAGGGGGGYYGGGMGHPNKYIAAPANTSTSQAGGGGGSSYINPIGSNIEMANSGPYLPNPVYAANYRPSEPNGLPPGSFIVPVNITAIGGSGIGPTQYEALGNDGGPGMVVIVY
jgi:hypothetical protein